MFRADLKFALAAGLLISGKEFGQDLGFGGQRQLNPVLAVVEAHLAPHLLSQLNHRRRRRCTLQPQFARRKGQPRWQWSGKHCLLLNCLQPVPLQRGPPGQPRNGQRRVDAQRGGHDGAVQHVQAGVALAGARGIEDAPGVVDHTFLDILAHRAAAQGVHAEQRAALLAEQYPQVGRQRAPQRVGQHLPNQAIVLQQTLHAVVALLDARVGGGLVPDHGQQASFCGRRKASRERSAQCTGVQLALSFVVTHHGNGHALLHRFRVDGGAVGRFGNRVNAVVLLAHPPQQCGRCRGFFEDAAQQGGHGQVLQHQAPARVLAAQVDHLRDGGANVAFAGCHRLIGHGVGFLAQAVQRGHDVAVA